MSSENLKNINFQEQHSKKRQYLVMRLESQLFGILVENIQDVLSSMKITPIPLAPPEVKGAMNLRGRIVTVINLRSILGMKDDKKTENYKSVILEIEGNLYSIIVDSVSEVMDIADNEIKRLPENISQRWKEVSTGVYSMENEVMIFLDAFKMFSKDEDCTEEAEV
ncbi:MAG: chemotaxis protein CheW [Rickettsiales bacterium]|nr:chemotaxis protein CheW [Pseudomonadota bacterium]MDA0966535.1 chemotaxis protein CheW [Pseudomonadota bacterium]MDG4543397.1 chemotaxis protein CheW [Rickettsiales bacterium]MDG4546639.1 chemotaxis protein CheW [Rickettsiales bacterium]MDG4548112.1 chemotaxis protein CheW [Rickettsiales bacterium]